MSEEKKGSNTVSHSHVWPISLAVIVAVLVTGVLAFYFMHRWFEAAQVPLDWPEKTARGLSRLLQSEVKIDGSSFTVGESEIKELALLQRQIVCTTKYESTFLRSKAIVIIRGVFTVKAGYDLGKPHRFSFDENGRVIYAEMPDPEILSITTENQDVYFVSEGIVNNLEPNEMEKAYRENLEQARREAREIGLLDEVESRMRERLGDFLNGFEAKVELTPAPAL